MAICPYGNMPQWQYEGNSPQILGPKHPKIDLFFLIFFSLAGNASSIRFQQALNHYQEIILKQDMHKKRFFSPQRPKYGYSDPYPMKIKKKFAIIGNISLIRFQRALNHYQTTILGQVMNFFRYLPFWAHWSNAHIFYYFSIFFPEIQFQILNFQKWDP